MEDARSVAHGVVDRLVSAYNAKDLAALVALYGPNPRYWSAISGSRDGVEEVTGHLRELFAALPDEQMAADVVVTDGTTAVCEFTSTGSTPAGEPYTISFTEVMTLQEGRIVEVKVYLDPRELPSEA